MKFQNVIKKKRILRCFSDFLGQKSAQKSIFFYMTKESVFENPWTQIYILSVQG
jgi:hypothetical protein